MNNNVLRLRDVRKITGLSRSSIYAMIKVGDFPRQIALGPRAVGWLDNEVQEWLAQRASLRTKNCNE